MDGSLRRGMPPVPALHGGESALSIIELSDDVFEGLPSLDSSAFLEATGPDSTYADVDAWYDDFPWSGPG